MTAALLTFQARSVIRGRWSLLAVAGFAFAAAVVAYLGLGSFRQLGLGAVGPAAVSLLNLALLLPTAQALLVGVLALSGERESGFMAALRARGMTAGAAVTATWLAVTLSAWLSLLAGFGVVAVIVSGSVPFADLLTFVGILLLCGLAAAVAGAIGMLIGAGVTNRLQAALVAVAVWFVLALGLDLIVIGLGVFLALGESAILAAVLANPLEAARVAALLLLDAEGGALGTMGQYLRDSFTGSGSLTLLVASLLLWIAIPLALGRWLLARRDL